MKIVKKDTVWFLTFTAPLGNNLNLYLNIKILKKHAEHRLALNNSFHILDIWYWRD